MSGPSGALAVACGALAITRGGALDDVQSLVQTRSLQPELVIPPLLPHAEVPLRAPMVDQEWLDQFHEAFGPLISRAQRASPKRTTRQADPGGSYEMDMNDMMGYLRMLFSAVKSEDFMKNMTQLSDGVRSITTDLRRASAAHVSDFVQMAAAQNSTDKVMTLVRRLFKEETNETKQYSIRIANIAFSVLDSMPKKMADDFRPILKLMINAGGYVMNVSMPEDCTSVEMCLQAGDFFANLTKTMDGTLKMRRMCNATTRMVPTISSYLDSMRPEVAPRVVFLIEQFTETTYFVASELIDMMEAASSRAWPLIQEKLECRLEKSAARAAGHGIGLLVALVSLAQSVLPH